MLNNEFERLNNNDQREVLKVRLEKDSIKERDQAVRVKYEEKQRVKL